VNKRFLALLLVAAALYISFGQRGAPPANDPPASGNSAAVDGGAQGDNAVETIAVAFAEKHSGVQVTGEGRVLKVLPDDNEGSRHQRFVLELSSGQTLLVAHNIDLAPRVKGLAAGDTIAFDGVYEWNAQGGVLHWTHRDPQGRHRPGWLRHEGKTYQ
jgi:ABC-type glycerol-3-phosphate transport system substrate-binding protein